MNFKALVLGGAMLLGAGVSAQAQTLFDGNSIDDILNLARGYGSASLEEQNNGDPKITGKIEGVQYAVYFMNCTDNKECEDLNFYAGFLDNKPTLELINEWNRDKRFGKAYLDSDNDAVIEFDVNLEHGVSKDNLDAAFEIWSLVLGQYTDHIGFK
jgi:Putative bacterial sensory transduction regulator